jgi:8-oxo-dGTP pyrophosphatase MutT (NUDIX family)
MVRRINKVYAHITRRDQLLVFHHVDFPGAGIQIPGGTLVDGEDPGVAVLREAYEETGLVGLRLVSYLGSHEWPISNAAGEEINLCHFYHLVCNQEVPDTWQHYERHPSDGSAVPILFEFYWLLLAEAEDVLPPHFTAKLDTLRGSPNRQADHQSGGVRSNDWIRKRKLPILKNSM